MNLTVEDKSVLRRNASGWLGGLITTILIFALTLGFLIMAALLLISGNFGMGLFILVLSIWMLFLTNYVWRDCRAKRGWLIEIEPGEIFLDLPEGRSLMANSPRVKYVLEVSDVLAIETRLEAYRSFGLANMQRSYGIRLKSGKFIVLGEDRGLATRLADETVGQLVDQIALRTGLPLRDIGMIEGRGGFLGVLFTSVPAWDTASLPADRQRAFWQRAGLTGGAACIVALAVLVLAVVF
jgi:hypothetical protein